MLFSLRTFFVFCYLLLSFCCLSPFLSFFIVYGATPNPLDLLGNDLTVTGGNSCCACGLSENLCREYFRIFGSQNSSLSANIHGRVLHCCFFVFLFWKLQGKQLYFVLVKLWCFENTVRGVVDCLFPPSFSLCTKLMQKVTFFFLVLKKVNRGLSSTKGSLVNSKFFRTHLFMFLPLPQSFVLKEM